MVGRSVRELANGQNPKKIQNNNEHHVNDEEIKNSDTNLDENNLSQNKIENIGAMLLDTIS